VEKDKNKGGGVTEGKTFGEHHGRQKELKTGRRRKAPRKGGQELRYGGKPPQSDSQYLKKASNRGGTEIGALGKKP